MSRPVVRRFRQLVCRPLVTLLAFGVVNVSVPVFASETAADVPPSSQQIIPAVSTALAPGALDRSIAVEARRAALASAVQGATTSADAHAGRNCAIGTSLLAVGIVSVLASVVKLHSWQTTTPPPAPGTPVPHSYIGGIFGGAVIGGVGTFMMTRGCGQ